MYMWLEVCHESYVQRFVEPKQMIALGPYWRGLSFQCRMRLVCANLCRLLCIYACKNVNTHFCAYACMHEYMTLSLGRVSLKLILCLVSFSHINIMQNKCQNEVFMGGWSFSQVSNDKPRRLIIRDYSVPAAQGKVLTLG